MATHDMDQDYQEGLTLAQGSANRESLEHTFAETYRKRMDAERAVAELTKTLHDRLVAHTQEIKARDEALVQGLEALTAKDEERELAIQDLELAAEERFAEVHSRTIQLVQGVHALSGLALEKSSEATTAGLIDLLCSPPPDPDSPETTH